MCGICGVCYADGRPVGGELLKAMTDTMRHRGPDGSGYLFRPGVGLGHRRLSIIDLGGGDQPIFNEDRSVAVVFNGEIYNYKELREELVRSGHTLATESDTEVLVHLYEDHGAALVDKLNGMYAFAIWDAPKRRLLLARDRLGEKPLYYRETSEGLVFASELKGVLAHTPCGSEDLAMDSVDDFLAYGYVPAPKSIFKPVRKLPAAAVLIYENGKATARKYWMPPWPGARRESYDEHEALQELERLLLDSVKIRLRADVPVGAFLSGGIDSSLVVALAAHVSETPLNTFCIGFGEARYDESAFARSLAERLGTTHHEMVVTDADLSILPSLVEQYDEPFADASAVPTYYVTREASRLLKVCLSGDGGDELFAGYSQYLWEPLERVTLRFPPPLRRALFGSVAAVIPPTVHGRGWLERLASTGAARQQRMLGVFTPEERRELLRPEFSGSVDDGAWLFGPYHERIDLDEIERRMATDQSTYLCDDILVKVDRDSMLNSIEVRVPFIDHRLVEFANGLGLEHKIRDGVQKRILKLLLRKLGLGEVAARKKQGFGLPLKQWLKRDSEWVRALLLSSDSRSKTFFRPAAIEEWLGRGSGQGRDVGERLWALLWFEQWCRSFKVG